MLKVIIHDRINRIAHSETFHRTHGLAHLAYLMAITAEGRGFHSVVGGVMAVFTVITIISSGEVD